MKLLVLAAIALVCSRAYAQDELSLFDSKGRASAYVVADDDLTIYLWGGQPVAYLVKEQGRDFDVYGFNGKHLGWFVNGIIRDHEGEATCALKEIVPNAQIEPLKGLKSLKSLKNLTELTPLRPLFSTQWGELPCSFFLSQGQ